MVFSNYLVIALSIISCFTGLFFKYLLCKAVYKDACELGDKNAVLWTILTAFFALLPVFFYAIFRYNKTKNFVSCPHCGKMVSLKEPVCMFCKQPVNDAPKRHFVSKEVKKYLILAAIYFVIDLVLKIIVARFGA